MRNSLERLSVEFEKAEERISNLKNTKGKKRRKNKQSLTDLRTPSSIKVYT
jgi:hypothetical protein